MAEAGGHGLWQGQGRGRGLPLLVAFGIVPAVAHAMLYIFLPYILLSTNLFAAAIPIPSPRTSPSSSPSPSTSPFRLVAFVIVATVALVNALHFVATQRRAGKKAAAAAAFWVLPLSESLSNLSGALKSCPTPTPTPANVPHPSLKSCQ